MNIRFLGHAAFSLEHDGVTVLIDPFLTGNPKASVSAAEVEADAILLTHGHRDHFGDTVDIARRTQCPVVAILELATEIEAEGVETRNPNIGGTVEFDWGSVMLTPAWHTSTTPKGTVNTPAGLCIDFGGKKIYHLGDTALFGDLCRPSQRGQVDVALMCIGGHFTMDRRDAVVACELVGARQVIPCHYNTNPLIQTDVNAFKNDVEQAGHSEVIVLEPGAVWPARG